ncbi:MAG: histidine phosphatase family protein [Rhodothermales bacterium]
MKHTAVVAFIVLFAIGPARTVLGQSSDAPTVVMVIRHAEKASDQGRDPSLTEAGEQRAEALIAVAGEAGVKAIYSSQFKRTTETVAPLARHLGIPVTTFEISGANLHDYPAMLAEKILTEHRGEAVVVVNHSNTVPAIVEALGGAPTTAMSEDEYDHFFIVVIPASGPARTIKAQYGL